VRYPATCVCARWFADLNLVFEITIRSLLIGRKRGLTGVGGVRLPTEKVHSRLLSRNVASKTDIDEGLGSCCDYARGGDGGAATTETESAIVRSLVEGSDADRSRGGLMTIPQWGRLRRGPALEGMERRAAFSSDQTAYQRLGLCLGAERRSARRCTPAAVQKGHNH